MEVKGVEKNKLNILNKFFSRNTFMIQQKLIPNWLAKFIIF